MIIIFRRYLQTVDYDLVRFLIKYNIQESIINNYAVLAWMKSNFDRIAKN